MQRSSRDAATVPAQLEGWLSGLLPDGAAPRVTLHSGIDANGMSSETLVLDVDWTDPLAGAQHGEYVARVAPAAGDLPVFPRYDLGEQYEAIRIVGERSGVPVPGLSFLEPTGEVLGTPFFLMERIDGVIPPDVLPYNFGGNWLADATAEQQRALQDATVATIAELHGIADPVGTFGFLDPAHHGHAGASLLARNVARTRAWYDYAVADLGRSPLVERGLAWLEAHLPTGPGARDEDAVLCWGDSRIGNMIYRDFAPVAVLDWEMAAIGPRALDLSWLCFAHQVFESIAGLMELPGMPDFLTEADVVATYERLTGVEIGDLTWYHVYNGLQWCIVFMRTGARQIHFGEIERPDDIEALFHCKPLVERILAQAGA